MRQEKRRIMLAVLAAAMLVSCATAEGAVEEPAASVAQEGPTPLPSMAPPPEKEQARPSDAVLLAVGLARRGVVGLRAGFSNLIRTKTGAASYADVSVTMDDIAGLLGEEDRAETAKAVARHLRDEEVQSLAIALSSALDASGVVPGSARLAIALRQDGSLAYARLTYQRAAADGSVRSVSRRLTV